jgi:hypothetical protein
MAFHTSTTSFERPAAALHYRWKAFQRNVSKFCGANAAVEKRNESGKSLDDQVRNACALYEQHNKGACTMLPLWLLLRYTQKWKDTITRRQSIPSSSQQTPSGTDSPAASSTRTIEDDSDVRQTGRKRAKKDNEEERKGLVESGQVMAEESRLKHIIFEKALILQEREHHEHILLHEESIMSRDISHLDDRVWRYYKLKLIHILRALEESIEKEKEDEHLTE